MFLATFDRHSDSPYRNYAIPDDGAEPTTTDVQALIAAYERRGRTPRLEYVPPWPPPSKWRCSPTASPSRGSCHS
ncbi:MAG: hypothetical protein ACRDZ4_03550 [Egibacteraceae bacterium]